MKDMYGREIDYLRISITDKCNLRCRYCMAEDQKFSNTNLSIDEFLKISKLMVDKGIKKIRITGGEPLLVKDLPLIIKSLKEKGIEDISITSNGLLLGKYAKELKEAGLTRVNISLDTLDKDKYKYITRGGDISKVFESIKACKDMGIGPIKINVVMLRNFNLDEFEDFLEFSDREDLIIRFIELMPIGEGNKFKDQIVTSKELIESHSSLKEYDYKKNTGPAQYYYREGKKGLIGFISPLSCSFCASCNRIRLDHEGNLIACLHSEQMVDLRDYIYDEEKLSDLIDETITKKPKRHKILEGKTIKRNMNTIGG